MKKFLLIIILHSTFYIINSFCFAQNRNIDSLLTLIAIDKSDTSKVKHLNRLSWEYINIGEFDRALKYGNKSLALARYIPTNNRRGWSKGIATAYNMIGNIYYFKGNYSAALENYLAAIKIMEEIGDKKAIAASYNNIGNIYYSQGNYPEALKSHFASIKIKEKIGDMKGIAFSYNNIGNIFNAQGNYLAALKNYFKALKLNEDTGNKKSIATSLGNIGMVYEAQGNYRDALKKMEYALKIFEEIKDKQNIAMSYYSIGHIYSDQVEYQKALKNYFASLKIQEDIGDKEGIAQSFVGLGEMQTKLDKLKEGQNYLTKALKISLEIGSKETIKKSYAGLAKLDSIQGNWKEAYRHHKLFIFYRDNIDNEETKKKTIESTMNYEFEKKETATKAEQDKKDVIAEANKKRQQVVLLLVSCVLLLVFIFAGFVVRSLRITRKQKNIIELQKNEVSRQKEIVSEKNKEITDSINYAQRIQRALLASDKVLSANLNYFIFFRPKDIVSGDFYWASTLANGNFALITADSTGHGVPGAIMSMLNISCLNEAVKGQQLTAPNEILNYTRSKIIEHLSNDGSAEGGKDGMDCSLLSFEYKVQDSINQLSTLDSQHLTKLIYSAANNPILIVRNKQIIELEPDKMPVGKHERDKTSFTQHTIELQKGDIVYTITDGYADQFGGPKGKKFMAKQLKELFISICNLPMTEQKEKLTAEFNSWKGNLEQVDDVTIIGIRV